MDSDDRDYTNGEITVFWRPDKCVHATTCYRELIEVFNPRKRPWVNMYGAPTDKIIEIVMKCPTQALSWKWNDPEKAKAEEALEAKKLEDTQVEDKPALIQVMKDGPIVIQGKFTIIDANGQILRTLSMTSLCRCGNSMSMPFCDGTHRKTGFRSDDNTL
jgi:CDGSH-type Zn-finger protein/uncharacterized Fe-S cluster protein YjdI